ncbi:hypothetical protein [uncultured Aquimarina sp.]|uniref:hypothetical protein n=1 Tax=uncultured Aquimarina sp. TaxID=575652 RepID=UPI00260B6B74|nr:hypothetical protein [uncultured Aquimarina sp.]
MIKSYVAYEFVFGSDGRVEIKSIPLPSRRVIPMVIGIVLRHAQQSYRDAVQDEKISIPLPSHRVFLYSDSGTKMYRDAIQDEKPIVTNEKSIFII